MQQEGKGETFRYSYDAGAQAEIRQIRQKYLPPEEQEDKLARLQRLDARVAQKGTAVALILGILGCLILGTGMSMIMVWGEGLFLPGVLVGLLGIGPILGAYPAYGRIVRRERQRLAPEILRLTDELMEN